MESIAAPRLGHPSGWYFLRRGDQIRPGQLLVCRFFGQDLILFRTKSGKLVASDPYCPHLGAHFGYGGEVVGEQLRCPFHGFCFDTEGACVSTPYGFKAPPKARLRLWEVRESHGLVLVWYDALGRDPWFEVPVLPMEGWPPFATHTWSLRSHPQETTENSVDLGHFEILHKYESVKVVEELQTDGPHLHTRYCVQRNALLFGRPGQMLTMEFDVDLYGLGYSQVSVEVKDYALRTRQLVLPTPTEDGHIDLTIGMTINIENRWKLNPFLILLPDRLTHWLVLKSGMIAYRYDVSQDFDVWQNKRYLEQPMLAKGDGPIGPYRKWCRQFYPDAPAAQSEPGHPTASLAV